MNGLAPIYLYSRHYFSLYYWHVYPYIMPLVYPVGMIAQSSSAYLTLCVTIERYVAVCRPLKARAICTYGRARTCVLVVGACAVAYNIPREICHTRSDRRPLDRVFFSYLATFHRNGTLWQFQSTSFSITALCSLTMNE